MSFPDEQSPGENGAGDTAFNGEAAQGVDIAQLQEALTAAEARAQEFQNQHLRTLAEMDNVRKRAARDVEQAHKYALERFAGELIGVKDTLEMGLAAGDTTDVQTLRAGTQATLQMLTRAFEKAGLQEVMPTGQPFNPEFHEAIALQPSADQPANSVLQVIQKGYLLNGRLLRPARVIVARQP